MPPNRSRIRRGRSSRNGLRESFARSETAHAFSDCQKTYGHIRRHSLHLVQVREERGAKNKQKQAGQRIERRNGQPQNAEQCPCCCTRPESGCVATTGPRICLPHLLQKACPGCTAAPHPSQNMPSSNDSERSTKYFNTGYAQKLSRFLSFYASGLSTGNAENEKAARQRGQPFLQGRIVPTEA
jgi:hypothetical protein